MKVLLCHNYYQHRGGEDLSFEAEADMLRSRGHDVLLYTRHNNDISRMRRFNTARDTIWNQHSIRELRALIERERPALVHCTNLFPLLSPSVYYAAKMHRLPVVQALRNYRYFCSNSFFLRDGQICERCHSSRASWHGILHGCYRQSRIASAVVATMQATHRIVRTWPRMVDLFYTPSEFARQKFIQGGFADDKIVVKPNFIHPIPQAPEHHKGYAVFIGRLSREKGIETLLETWIKHKTPLPLKIVGEGPEQNAVLRAANSNEQIEWLGPKPLDEVLRIVSRAALLVMPSVWFETFGRTIIEAFSTGTPAVVSNLGAMAELVKHGKTGFLFKAGDSLDLAQKVSMIAQDPKLRDRMGRAARQEFLDRFTLEKNYELLMQIYDKARNAASDRAMTQAPSMVSS